MPIALSPDNDCFGLFSKQYMLYRRLRRTRDTLLARIHLWVSGKELSFQWGKKGAGDASVPLFRSRTRAKLRQGLKRSRSREVSARAGWLQGQFWPGICILIGKHSNLVRCSRSYSVFPTSASCLKKKQEYTGRPMCISVFFLPRLS